MKYKETYEALARQLRNMQDSFKWLAVQVDLRKEFEDK